MRCISGGAGRNWGVFVAYGLTVCLLSGCSSRYEGQTSLPETAPGPAAVTLSAGDVVEVRFFYTPELNVTQTVRPDGEIALQLVGDVPVQGKTPAEIRQDLLQRYALYLKEPDVAVVVQSFYHRRVYVGGQVQKPGVVPMPGPITALEAIMESGGFVLPQAQTDSVVIIRCREDRRYAYCIDLKPALKGAQTRAFYLEPQDVVYVPQTRITEVGQWVDQHINNVLPKTGLVVLTNTGGTTIGYSLR
jgi:protein involved in polysaccharide export with SLBB domain